MSRVLLLLVVVLVLLERRGQVAQREKLVVEAEAGRLAWRMQAMASRCALNVRAKGLKPLDMVAVAVAVAVVLCGVGERMKERRMKENKAKMKQEGKESKAR